ncbi:hypothetical protein ABZ883_04555 [Streptomyces sp. NPDC046977]|uniref:hypothetical protein n=1 Tax=Streptomyces sp. NPDC046977 TaxID=3154703 RepID=UPI00340FC07C
MSSTAPPTDTDDEAQDAVEIRPFSDVLREMSGGQTHAEMSRRLHDLIEAVQVTGRGGKIAISFEVKPISGADGTVTITDTITAKVPQAARPKTIFFVGHDGNLSRTDPKQLPLVELREVEAAAPASIDSLRTRKRA